jgi:glycosyltransferase involved in cell wall biosynthesis
MNFNGRRTSGSQRIRVLFLIDSFAHEAGTENQLIELIRRIDRDRFEIHVACIEDSPKLRSLASIAKTVIFPTVSMFSGQGLAQVFAVNRYIRAHSIDVVHTFMNRSNILGVMAAHGSGCRAVLASRRNLGYWHTPGMLALLRLLNARTTRLVANAVCVKDVVVRSERAAAAKVDVLYNGVDIEQFTPGKGDPQAARRLGIADSSRVVGIVANLRPVKDLALFLRAAAIVARAVPDVVFLIVGHGPLRDDLIRLASELDIKERLFFSSSDGAVLDYLSRMSVACLSSESEGFSNAILEYMAVGLPVVATDVGGNREAIEHGVTGYVVGSRSPEEFAKAIVTLLTDDSLRSRMGAAGLERCRTLFNMATVARNYEHYYARLVGSDAV